MVPIYRKQYEDGELLLGWPTWDPTGKMYGEMSVKYSYPRSDGRPSRGSPEIPIRIAVDMVLFAAEHGQLTHDQSDQLRTIFSS